MIVIAAVAWLVCLPPPNYIHRLLECCNRHSLLDQQGRLMLKNLTFSELEEWCTAAGVCMCLVGGESNSTEWGCSHTS